MRGIIVLLFRGRCVPCWISTKRSPMSERAVDFDRRDLGFLRQTMQDDRAAFVKEVEHAVVHSAEANAQLRDPVAKEVGFWPPEFVAEFRQPFETHPTLGLRRDAAAVIAERIRSRMQALEIPHARSVAGVVTVSIGTSTVLPNQGDRSALFDAADAAMYEAKRLGRNRVESATHPSVVEGAVSSRVS